MFGRDAREPKAPELNNRTRAVVESEDTDVTLWREALRIARENIKSAQAVQTKHYNKKSHHEIIDVGDLVLLRINKEGQGKFDDNYTGPYKVLNKKQNNYTIELTKEKSYYTHLDRLKLFQKKDSVDNSETTLKDQSKDPLSNDQTNFVTHPIENNKNQLETKKDIPENFVQKRYNLRPSIKKPDRYQQ